MRALVADDSGVIRSIVKRAFADFGFDEIDESPDGADAITKVQAVFYDIIVTDWNMPFKNGLDVTSAARQAGQKCPIIMQTTESDKSSVMQAIAAGCNDYVLKPFNKEQLLEKLERHVKKAIQNKQDAYNAKVADEVASEG